MKKTLTLMLAAVATFSLSAANYFTVNEAQQGTPVKMENVKKAPAGMQAKMMARLASQLKATPNFPASTPDDLVGGYAWTYRQYTGGMTTQPDTISNNYTFQRDTEDNVDLIGINKISDTQIRLTGFMPLPITATMGTTSNYTTFTVDADQVVYSHSTYGDCSLQAAWYYEGDDTYDAGWYVGDVMGILVDEGIVMDPDVHFYMVISSGNYAGYRLGWIYEPASTMVPATDFNAMMSFTYNNAVYDWPVIATENTDTYVVSVDNFAGIGTTPVTFTLAEDKTWSADQTVFYTSGDNNFAFYAIDGENFVQETGTGTEKVLTFGQNWTGYDTTTNYWLGERSATTITLISDEEFVYPTPAPQHAYYLIGGFNEWNQEAMIPFVENNGVYTLTYTFGGEFKVKDEAGNWWGGGVTLTEENPSVTLVDGGNLNLDQQAEYTLTIENGVLTVSGFPAPQVVEYNDFFVCGSFNGWNQSEGLVELVANEEGTEFTGTVEFEANAEFKLITHNLAGGWKWFGGSTNGDNFMIGSDMLGVDIALVDGSNFQVEEGGSYDITVKQASSKGLQEPLTMVISKTPTTISTIANDTKTDNAYYNLMGVKFNGMPSVPGIYIHNGRKVVIK